MDAAVQSGLSPAEFLAFERAAERKHQYVGGAVFAMAGASREHNLLVGNIVRALGNALRDRPCEVYPSDMRVKAETADFYTYPDVSVVCAEPHFEDDAFDTLLNPRVIIEVLSEHTEAYDRGKKFELYRQVPSLTDYVLVSQSERLIEHFVRQPDDSWTLREIRPGKPLRLVSLDCQLYVEDIYLKVLD